MLTTKQLSSSDSKNAQTMHKWLHKILFRVFIICVLKVAITFVVLAALKRCVPCTEEFKIHNSSVSIDRIMLKGSICL